MKQIFQKRTSRPSLSANEGNGGRIDVVQQKSRKAWKQMRFLQFVCVLAMACFPLMSMAYSDYFSKVIATVSPTGAGKVYVSKNSTNNPSYVTSSSEEKSSYTTSEPTHTYYLYAKAEPDYVFKEWTENGTQVSTSPTNFQPTVTASSTNQNNPTTRSFVAVFERRPASLTVNPQELEMETRPGTPVTATFNVSGQHIYDNGVTLTFSGDDVFTISRDGNNYTNSITLDKGDVEAQGGVNITVKYNPTDYQNYTGKITISSQDAESKEVNLTGYSDAYPVTIGSAKATTLYVDFPLKNPKDFYKNDNLVVSYAKEVTDKGNDKKELKLEAMGDYIPANTGVVVQGNPNSDGYYFMKYHGSAALTPVDVNLLKGTTTTISRESVLENAPEGSLVMTLSVLNNTLGFYKYIGDNLSANKAYILYTPTDGGNVSFLSLGVDGDEELDVIHDVKVKVTDDAWYTLQGARLNGKPTQRGIYIHGGKKVAVK